MNHFARIPIKLRAVAPRFILAAIACWAVALLYAGRSEAQIRTPLGVYAHVDVPAAIQADITGPNANHNLQGVSIGPCSALPSTAASTVHTDLRKLYAGLLQSAKTSPPTDPVSGIELGVPWCLVHPCDPTVSQCNACEPGSSQCTLPKEDWSWISDVFEVIASDPTLKNKTVQLSVNPGFDTPQWLLDDINKAVGSCDGYFNGSKKKKKKKTNANCGTVTFTNFPECPHVAGQVLPLPWNSIYTSSWQAFLGDLRGWLQTVPNEQALVSISVAGPSGASPELILPATGNNSYVLWYLNNGVPTPTLGCSTAGGGFAADIMWHTLIKNAQIPNSPNSNPLMYSSFPPQVFVDYLNNAIDLYEGIFSGITLVLTPDSGSGFPEIGSPKLFPIPATTSIVGVDNSTANALWMVDCSTAPTDYAISCGAKAEILAHFVLAQTYVANASNNARSTYVGGMTSSTCIQTGFIDLPGVKVLTSWSSLSLPRQPFVGGAQFDHAVSGSPTDRSKEGCPGTTCSPDQATYNALTDFFNATEGNQYFKGPPPEGCTGPPLQTQTAPIQYVNISYNDIQYAKGEICPIPTQPAISGTCTTTLDLLNQTQYYLSNIAGGGGTAPGPSCPYAAPACRPSCQIPTTACQGCSVTCSLSQKAVCTPGEQQCESGETHKTLCECESPPNCTCE